MGIHTQKLCEFIKLTIFYGFMFVSVSFLPACSIIDGKSHKELKLSGNIKQNMSDEGYETGKGLPIEGFYTEKEKKMKVKINLGLTASEAKLLGCSIADRFDRKAALAYNFKDEQTRISLHLGVSGPNFSDLGKFELNKVMLRFTYNFQKPSASQSRKTKCLFPSGFQGIIGSAYNELFVRENYTIWHELREKGINFR